MNKFSSKSSRKVGKKKNLSRNKYLRINQSATEMIGIAAK
jgi:hypothetical protein